jgi:GGDEF domain-containing protein
MAKYLIRDADNALYKVKNKGGHAINIENSILWPSFDCY